MVIVKIFLKFYFKSYHDLLSPIVHNISLPNLNYILQLGKLCKFTAKESPDIFFKTENITYKTEDIEFDGRSDYSKLCGVAD